MRSNPSLAAGPLLLADPIQTPAHDDIVGIPSDPAVPPGLPADHARATPLSQHRHFSKL